MSDEFRTTPRENLEPCPHGVPASGFCGACASLEAVAQEEEERAAEPEPVPEPEPEDPQLILAGLGPDEAIRFLLTEVCETAARYARNPEVTTGEIVKVFGESIRGLQDVRRFLTGRAFGTASEPDFF